MQATQLKQPFHREGWVYEEKIDGWRMLAYKDGRSVRLESRNAKPAVSTSSHATRPFDVSRRTGKIRSHRDGWVYEEKLDGWRMLAYKDGDRVHLVSRNGRDHTRRFRDIATAISKLSARTLVLDGEVAIYDQQLRSASTDCLREPDPDAIASPPLFIAAAEGAVTVLPLAAQAH